MFRRKKMIGKVREGVLIRKCLVCKETEDLHYVRKYGIYGEACWSKHRYHPACLKRVCESPEDWGSEMVDKVLGVLNCIDHWDKRRVEAEVAREKLVGMLSHHVE